MANKETNKALNKSKRVFTEYLSIMLMSKHSRKMEPRFSPQKTERQCIESKGTEM
jgi:hypothetical protein